MNNSKIKFNFFASLVGLMLTGGVVFLSASQSTTSTAAASQLAMVTQTASAPATTQVASTNTLANIATTKTTPAVATNSSGYTNGTYTATASYRTPGSGESIKVSLTLQKGVVTSATVANSGNDRESARYQNNFAAAFKQYVVGKSISSLSLSRVSGASLTTAGFDSAIAQIKSEASA